ncbi:DUF1146 domain-containing protein [Pluralibacter gergoviae]|nr:hypothetical protein AZ034_002338 [Pluralibacter gergoviae]OUF56303.1 hypothetical protein AZ044_002565 [Pluralibacter gergoviae]SUB72457.1 Uncharacterised protein [Pluralibacter gergoviae]
MNKQSVMQYLAIVCSFLTIVAFFHAWVLTY